MSYDLGLYYDNGELAAEVENHKEGGTYALGGITQAELNITYNYASLYRDHLDTKLGIHWLYGKTGKETTRQLEKAITALGTERNTEPFWQWKLDYRLREDKLPQDIDNEGKLIKPDELKLNTLNEAIKQGRIYNGGSYWKPTPGNAGYALSILLDWAKQHPEAVWHGD